ncbi:hypothetical protein AN219_03095 [Streptomyces nanshensis]|nr:hypothetical protein AN219_03095 [Streptomyces nanshensis]
MDVNSEACEKTPGAIRKALERRPDWLMGFTQDFMCAAGEFDQAAMDAAVDKWFPAACACATPGYVDEIEDIARRMNEGDTEGLVFWDSDGNAWDADNNPLPRRRSGS